DERQWDQRERGERDRPVKSHVANLPVQRAWIWTVTGIVGARVLRVTVIHTCSWMIVLVRRTLASCRGVGRSAVKIPTEASDPTTLCPGLHARPARTRLARTSTLRTRRVIGPRPSCSGRATLPTPVGVRGPPSAGIQPTNGMKLDGRPAGPTETALKTS